MEQSPLSAAKLSVSLPVSVPSTTEYTSKPEGDDDPNRLVAGSALSVTTSILGGRKRHRQCSADSHHVDVSVSESVPPVSKVQHSNDDGDYIHDSGIAYVSGEVVYDSDVDHSFNDNFLDEPLTTESYSDEEVELVTLKNVLDTTIGNHPGDSETPKTDNSFRIEEEFTTPLYDGARISLGISLMLLMSFVIKHGLSDSAVRDLLQVISSHCPAANLCVTSLYLFKKYFAKCRFPSRRHYYCNSCKAPVSEFDQVCPTSACASILPVCSRSYFVEISIEEQLRSLFKRPGFYEDIQYRFQRQKLQPDSIEDVYDGKLYQAQMEPGKFLTNPCNLSFQWNIDGVPLFHSSKYGMWPLYLKINELPPKKRDYLTNKILAGIWLGDGKPAINTYFKPVYHTLQKLHTEGVLVSSPHITGPFQCHAIMLSGTCDMPAKAVALNMIGHNGFYGCPKCTQPGITYKTRKGGNVHVYPYNASNPVGPVRTSESLKHDAKVALRMDTVVNGIRGPGSCLATLPQYDVIKGMSIDYMHCVLINIVRLLISLWFESKYSSELWSCSRSESVVDARMESIRPPNFITRAPRGVSKRKFWKASEYRSWLFFYSLPVMGGILHTDYYQHYVLLCEAIYILNSSVNLRELKKCSKLLQHFYFKFPMLYSERYLSCNMHQILHLPTVVEDLGPLFTSSCFDHEDSNGKLAKMVHSHSCVDSQILASFGTLQTLSDLASAYLEHDQEEFELFREIVHGSKVPQCVVEINSECCAVGAITEVKVDTTLLQMFESAVQPTLPITCSKFGRLLLRGEMFHSQLYKRPAKQNSYTVLYKDKHSGENLIGLISYFLLVNFECHHNADCIQCKNQVFAVVTPLTPSPSIKLANDPLTGASVSHIVPCCHPDDVYIVVHANTIMEKLVYMSFCNEEYVYVARSPNKFECD